MNFPKKVFFIFRFPTFLFYLCYCFDFHSVWFLFVAMEIVFVCTSHLAGKCNIWELWKSFLDHQNIWFNRELTSFSAPQPHQIIFNPIQYILLNFPTKFSTIFRHFHLPCVYLQAPVVLVTDCQHTKTIVCVFVVVIMLRWEIFIITNWKLLKSFVSHFLE